MAIDPVCGMKVDERTTRYSYAFQGTSYYFCCQHCLETFKKDPAKYLKK
ncbi:MAG: YHS domain-containing protein [Aigarchaeota archaeon]|nr:YHS domain-containing protein [Aigarchaeota archaeon]MCS7118002.1 YHS domain-containing protein [Candidatus Calditenuaceae archaeon]MDW8041892.1 YHS domain-containing protein [Nitrososphaerota archaeon]